MSIIKSFSVDDGDMFYIDHNSDNFTIIDCNLSDMNTDDIIDELNKIKRNKSITRFISTHPDQDHISGLKSIEERVGIENFYCVKNQTIKSEETEDFKKYRELKESKKSFYIYKGVRRKYMNQGDDKIGNSGLSILWPDINNEHYKKELEKVKKGDSPNNISPIIKYSLKNGINALWMGDLETDFMECISEDVDWPETDILFAPHHGRKSAKIPLEILEKINPKIVVIGEAPSDDILYNIGKYKTLTQNSSKGIIFECIRDKVHVFVKEKDYSVTFLEKEPGITRDGFYYIGTLNLTK